MTDLRKAAEMALEAMDDVTFGRVSKFPDARKALRQALAQHVDAVNISAERVDETAKREHEPVANDYDKSIHSNPDAQAWAKFFMVTVNEQKWCIDDIDESLMIGWFANAMMAMHDHVKREWVGLTVDEARKFYEKYTDREELIYAIDKFLEEKNT